MSSRRRQHSSSSESADSEEQDRRKDIKERDEFSKRMKSKDEDRTRKVAESKSQKQAYEEAAKRLRLESDDRERLVPKLRVQSRRDYLAKRKDDKVAELEADILDDEYLFDEAKITDREKKEREHKKTLLSIAKDHEKARNLERVQRYHMPKDMKKGEKGEYQEVDEREKLPNSEQKKWEAEQLAAAQYKFGSRDAGASTTKEYELLLEDQIDFIQVLRMGGSDEKDRPPEVSENERQKMTIAETKKSLPVYPFRDDLIKAIREHQVLIIEGETGNFIIIVFVMTYLIFYFISFRKWQNNTDSAISLRSWFYERWQKDRMYTTTSCCCYVSCCTCSTRDGC